MLVGSTYSHVGISPRFFVLKLTPLAECSWENRTCVVSSNLLYMCLSARHIQLLQVHCLGWPICCTILQTCSQCKLNSGPYWYVSIISQVHCPSATDAHYVGIVCLELTVHSDLFCRRPLPRVCVCLILIRVRYCMSGDFCAQSVCSCFVLSVFLIWLLELFLCIITTSCFNPVMGHGSAMVAASGIMSLRQLFVLRITHLVGDLVSITLAKLTFSRPFYNNILLKHIL